VVEIKTIHEEILAKIDANQEETGEGQEEIKAQVGSLPSQRDIIQEKMDAKMNI
jgi:hypothetical protein